MVKRRSADSGSGMVKRRSGDGGSKRKSKKRRIETTVSVPEEQKKKIKEVMTKKELYKMKVAMKKITRTCKKAIDRLKNVPTKRMIFQSLKAWQRKKFTVLRFSWLEKDPFIIPPPYKQISGNCWAVSLYRAWFALMRRLRRKVDQLTIEKIMEEAIPLRYQSAREGIRYFKHTKSFMEKYVDKMLVHDKPEGQPSQEEDYEYFLESLLAKGPVAVGIIYFPSYRIKKFRGVLSPSHLEKEKLLYERFTTQHALLLTGRGIDTHTGEEYWELLDSQGSLFGERGFIRLKRHEGLIIEAVELQLGP